MLRVSFQGRNAHRKEFWTSFYPGRGVLLSGLEMDSLIPCPAAGIAGKGAVDWKGKCGATQSSGFKQVEKAKFSFKTCYKIRELWNKAKKGGYSNNKIPIPSNPMEFQCTRFLPQGQGTGSAAGGDLVSLGPKCF